jgi:spore coat polysaccharide biosynthesis protein SpsF
MMGSVNPHIDKIGQLIRSHASTAVFIHMNISASQLHDLLSECDCCICPASSISLEACATGIVLISGYTADNQLKILKGLQHENVLFNWGDFRNLSPASIQSKFGELLLHPEQFGIMLQNQQHLIDGKSPSRLLNVFRSLASKRLHFRYATESDTDLYFKWSNDALVRRNSFNQQTIEYNNHVAWFRAKLKAADFKFYLFFNDANKAVGQVRINRQNGETIIGISVDSEFRGLSYSTEMLTSATDAYFRIYPEATVTAYIKTENTPSLTTFKRAGFINNIQVMQDGYSCYKLNKKRTHDAYN